MTDPGWGEAIRLGLTYRMAQGSNLLITMRALFVIMTAAMVGIVLVAVVLVSTADLPGEVEALVASVAVLVVGVAGAAGASTIKPPLRCESDGALVVPFAPGSRWAWPWRRLACWSGSSA